MPCSPPYSLAPGCNCMVLSTELLRELKGEYLDRAGEVSDSAGNHTSLSKDADREMHCDCTEAQQFTNPDPLVYGKLKNDLFKKPTPFDHNFTWNYGQIVTVVFHSEKDERNGSQSQHNRFIYIYQSNL